jgi:hypothetical protein
VHTPTPDEVEGLGVMLAELESNRLEVVLAPCKRPSNVCGYIRVVASRNADWYRKFCAAHPSGRNRRNALPDTRIRRRDIGRLLRRLSAGQPSSSKYADELIRIARKVSASSVPF